MGVESKKKGERMVAVARETEKSQAIHSAC